MVTTEEGRRSSISTTRSPITKSFWRLEEKDREYEDVGGDSGDGNNHRSSNGPVPSSATSPS